MRGTCPPPPASSGAAPPGISGSAAPPRAPRRSAERSSSEEPVEGMDGWVGVGAREAVEVEAPWDWDASSSTYCCLLLLA